MWHDMVLFWAWRGPVPIDSNGRAYLPPQPSNKRIEYSAITDIGRYLNGPSKGEPILMDIAVTVFDDDHQTEINREELKRLQQN